MVSDGKKDLQLDGTGTYYGTGSDLPYFLDPQSSHVRATRLSDVEIVAHVVENVKEIDFSMSLGLPSDVPPHAQDIVNFLVQIENTAKPIVATAFSRDNLALLAEMETSDW